jgi:hypothetical protein
MPKGKGGKPTPPKGKKLLTPDSKPIKPGKQGKKR